jgi:hypothetical protein
MRFDFIAEKQIWTVQIEQQDEQSVFVTATFERTVRNKTKSNKHLEAWCEAEDYRFSEGKTKIVECSIQSEAETCSSSEQTERDHDVQVKTSQVVIKPDETATISGKITQYRRISDSMYETFRQPIVNPQIRVLIDEDKFSHDITFGTYGDKTKSKYENLYTLSGVYFPGQYMVVRWWPKAPKASANSLD